MKNNIFVIATRHFLYDYQKRQKLYNIKTNYLIINHGASVFKKDKIIYNQTIDNNIKNRLLHDLNLKDSIKTFACNGLQSRLSLYDDDLTKIHIRYSYK